ncbi:hypothetical protein H6G89_11025 [Oscillatoria sp. FACHB-1407]|uniref:hypothetical protein n=1 Tax=Oscillatoria sp. FACHB-1407 TaxID=2692847 RepID=UPI001685F34C|nr:hypothetical protein [Oscillatoria sp. FACHB-1407]MBD2461582.1 hypothetical protein [Oscillatoria sp. FACHB-1407]
MNSWSATHNTANSAEQHLYDYLLKCVETEAPDEVIATFRKLFIDATGYSDRPVWQAVETVVGSAAAEREFKFVLNRSCHILINRWLMQPRLHPYIPELVALFETDPSGLAYSRTTKRLRSLVRTFVDSEQYLALKRLTQITNHAETTQYPTEAPLGTLIHRYPCLYEHSLLTEDSTNEQRRRVRRLRLQTQHQFELDLSQYITYRQRCHLRSQLGVQSDEGNDSQRELVVVKNPTLLSDRQLDLALRQFTGKVDSTNTHRDLAKQFLTYGKQAPSYRRFKQELYSYLITSVDPRYGKYHFNTQLSQHLQDTLPHCDGHQVSDFLLVETCKRLLNFLVVESAQEPNHSRFVDLAGNIGIAFTVSLLLKIVLLCRAVKPWLEKRFAILFQLHEGNSASKVLWLLEALEHLNIALVTNFGTMRLSLQNSWVT